MYQAFDTFNTFLLVELQNHFGVGLRFELAALLLKLAAQLDEVVNLAIESDPESLVSITHRLVAGRRQIENAQATVP